MHTTMTMTTKRKKEDDEDGQWMRNIGIEIGRGCYEQSMHDFCCSLNIPMFTELKSLDLLSPPGETSFSDKEFGVVKKKR